MKATITINMDNAAFEDDREGELSRILHVLANQIVHGDDPLRQRTLRDSNGNAVGEFAVSGKVAELLGGKQ